MFVIIKPQSSNSQQKLDVFIFCLAVVFFSLGAM